MKRTITYPIIMILLSLAVLAQQECEDGMTLSIQGGDSFSCHIAECENLTVEVSITPHQDALSGEYDLTGCTNIDPLQDNYTGAIKYHCPCTDDYVFNLTTAQNSNGTYHLIFNQTIIEYGPEFTLNMTNATIQETDTFTIELEAQDNDTAQSNLAYSTTASFGSMTNSTYTWQTDYDSEGTYNITFFVSDGKHEDNQTVILKVTHKDKPSPPPSDDDDTSGGGGGGGYVSTCGDGICSGYESCDNCAEDCGECEEESAEEEETAEAETEEKGGEGAGEEETGLEGVTGGAAGNITEEQKNEGLSGILGAVIGGGNKSIMPAIGLGLIIFGLLGLAGMFILWRKRS